MSENLDRAKFLAIDEKIGYNVVNHSYFYIIYIFLPIKVVCTSQPKFFPHEIIYTFKINISGSIFYLHLTRYNLKFCEG